MIKTAVTGTIAGGGSIYECDDRGPGPWLGCANRFDRCGSVAESATYGPVSSADHACRHVCIGIPLMAQGVAQLVSGVPLTVGEIVTKMLTFAALTLVGSGLLTRMAQVAARNASQRRYASLSKGSGSR
jgi:hypothetical protein